VVLTVGTWRWAAVPFRLRSGKAMSATRKEAVITFKQRSLVLDGLTGSPPTSPSTAPATRSRSTW
jgi:glucose-6-phosphate 1-dehydrogenase